MFIISINAFEETEINFKGFFDEQKVRKNKLTTNLWMIVYELIEVIFLIGKTLF